MPNFSEGRRKDVIETIANAIRTTSGVTLLDVESNADHNRSVMTFVGEPRPVKEAALAAGRKAVELIDLNHHKGEHPRMGAVDVVPFIPISGVTMEDCVLLAKDFGKEFAETLHVPVFLYEEAASSPQRHNLADVRVGEFEGLRDLIGKDPSRKPDFGPEKIHPTAGATAVGAREILIAYNVNLGTGDLNVAKKIARELRSKDGGLTYVKALGFELKERGIVQVSMNLTNYRKSQLFKAYELVKLFAERNGVPVIGSEIVGLTPMDALVDASEFYLRLENFSREQVLESRMFAPRPVTLTDQSLTVFSEEVASKRPTPGGGSVSAYVGALAASLLCMVARITLGRRDATSGTENLSEVITRGEELRQRLLRQVNDDSEAFNSVVGAFKLPKDLGDARKKEIEKAKRRAAEAPLTTLDLTVQVLQLVVETARYGTMSAISDVSTAVAAAVAAEEGAASNVTINLESMEDKKYVAETNGRVFGLRKDAVRLQGQIKMAVESRSRGK